MIGEEEEGQHGTALAANGFDLVLTVSQREIPLEKRHPGIRYSFIPLRDEPNFRMDFFMHRASEELSRSQGRALVHCVAGISRSPSIYLGHRLLTDPQASLEKEMGRLSRLRPQINPNIGFFYQLKLLDAFPFHLRINRRVYFAILALADQCCCMHRLLYIGRTMLHLALIYWFRKATGGW